METCLRGRLVRRTPAPPKGGRYRRGTPDCLRHGDPGEGFAGHLFDRDLELGNSCAVEVLDRAKLVRGDWTGDADSRAGGTGRAGFWGLVCWVGIDRGDRAFV